jgi:hypothetical protein
VRPIRQLAQQELAGQRVAGQRREGTPERDIGRARLGIARRAALRCRKSSRLRSQIRERSHTTVHRRPPEAARFTPDRLHQATRQSLIITVNPAHHHQGQGVRPRTTEPWPATGVPMRPRRIQGHAVQVQARYMAGLPKVNHRACTGSPSKTGSPVVPGIRLWPPAAIFSAVPGAETRPV